MRRVEKTSVVKAGTYGMARIYIDARAFEEGPYISYGDLLEALRRELRRLLPVHRGLGELLARVRGVSSIREVRREDRDKAVCQGAGA